MGTDLKRHQSGCGAGSPGGMEATSILLVFLGTSAGGTIRGSRVASVLGSNHTLPTVGISCSRASSLQGAGLPSFQHLRWPPLLPSPLANIVLLVSVMCMPPKVTAFPALLVHGLLASDRLIYGPASPDSIYKGRFSFWSHLRGRPWVWGPCGWDASSGQGEQMIQPLPRGGGGRAGSTLATWRQPAC